MESTMRKIGAICAKDFPDLFKNPVMIICALLPIVFVLWFGWMVGDSMGPSATELAAEQGASRFLESFSLTMGACMTAGMVPSMVVLYSIAEEKEKHTLRTLMLANVSGGQVLAAKSVVALVVTAVVDAVIFLLSGAPLGELGVFLVLAILGTMPIILLSLVLGLVARDQMSSGLFSLPIILVALAPLFGAFSSGLDTVVALTPCGGMQQMIVLMAQGSLFTQEAVGPLLTVIAWIALMSVLFLVLYKRLGRDN